MAKAKSKAPAHVKARGKVAATTKGKAAKASTPKGSAAKTAKRRGAAPAEPVDDTSRVATPDPASRPSVEAGIAATEAFNAERFAERQAEVDAAKEAERSAAEASEVTPEADVSKIPVTWPTEFGNPDMAIPPASPKTVLDMPNVANPPSGDDAEGRRADR